MPSKQPSNHLNLRSLRLCALLAGAAATVVGVFVLLGWMFDVSVLKSVLPGKATMKPNAALCFVLTGMALMFLTVANGRRSVNQVCQRLALVCSALVAIVSVATLSEYSFRMDLKIDWLLFRNALLAEGDNALGGRMAGATSLAFAFLGLALMLRDVRSKSLRLFSELFSLASLLIGMVALIGYAYGIESLYTSQAFRSMAVHTAVLFFIMGIGVLLARPQRGVIAVIVSDHTGGIMARRVLPLAVLVPFLIGWLRLAGERAGLYGTEFGLALFATSNITIFAAIIWVTARSLNRTEANRRIGADKLRASVESFRQLADVMPQIVWTARPDGWLDYFNQRWLDYTGLTLAESEGFGWEPVLHSDDLQSYLDTWDESVRTGKPYEIKYRIKRAEDSVYRWYLGRASAIRDEHGQILKWIGTGTDIDDQKRAEEALERSHFRLETRVEQRTSQIKSVNLGLQEQIAERRTAEAALLNLTMLMGTILDSASYAIISTNVDGTIQTFNKAAERLLGYTAKEMVGKETLELFHDPLEIADRARALSAVLGKSVAPGIEVFMAKARTGSEDENEWSYVRRDGTRFPVLLSITALHNHDGLVTGYLGVGSDITERKLAAEALSISEKRYRELVDNGLGLICTHDLRGTLLSVNPAVADALGYDRAEMIGRNLIHFISPSAKALFPHYLKRVAAEPSVSGLMNLQTRTGEERVWTFRNSRIGEAAKNAYVLGYAQDVTDRISLENELKQARDSAIESARIKAEFLANMSHEIRTPMNGIIGMTELVLDTTIDTNQRRYINTIKTSGESLLTIINDILDFSKIEAGMLSFETIDFDLRFSVESVMEMMAGRVQAKELELALVFHPDVPTKLCGDPTRLKQILTNLVANGIKFTDWGKVAIRISKDRESEQKVTIRFEVTDTGIGISPEAQKGLFAPFVQADGSVTRHYGGTGLGLAISKQLVEMMGGTISVSSEPGHGSTFTFALALDKQISQEATSPAEPGSVDLQDMRVLIVDDNHTNRQILNQHMTSWGMIAEEAADSVTAIMQLRQAVINGEPFHLALLDQEMPDVSGLELAKLIRSDATIANLRLVLMPSSGKRGQTKMARDVGIDAYFTKPVRRSQLLECLLAVMSDRRKGSPQNLITRHSLSEVKASLSRHILLVEDNEVNQTVALGQLAKLGYRVDVASNGQQALDAMSRRSYDAVLMDCQMPIMDGYTATREIRNREEGLKHTPIIAMTAFAMNGDRDKCLAAGMDNYIAKPVKRLALANLLEGLFANGSLAGASAVAELPLPIANELLPVDLECLKDAVSDNPDKLRRIIALYLTHTAERLAELRVAISQRALGDVYGIAHKCLGSSRTCGMTAIVPSLRELERIGKEGDLTNADDHLNGAHASFEQIKQFLTEYLAQLAG